MHSHDVFRFFPTGLRFSPRWLVLRCGYSRAVDTRPHCPTTFLMHRPPQSSPDRPNPWEGPWADLSLRGQRLARRLTGGVADSEELVQEAYCRLIEARYAVTDGDCSISGGSAAEPTKSLDRSQYTALFFRTLRNLCIDRLRKRQVRSLGDFSAVEPAARPAGIPLMERELQQTVAAAIDRLPESWRDALLLRIDGDLSYVEIADILQCTVGQVRTWIFRARRQLAEWLRDCLPVGQVEPEAASSVRATAGFNQDDA